jgi:4-hydroxybenzoate polyprenyltransferase
MAALRDYLQLMRFPAVFTAMADIILGFMLNHERLDEAPVDLIFLLIASSCLYLAGMVFNDVFDRQVDLRERPNRPIPSGRVPLTSAVAVGGVLVLGGIAAAANVGIHSLTVAGFLTLCIFLYDGFAKQTVLGPVVMGGCRFLNIILGASAQERAFMVWGGTLQFPQMWIATGLGIYIAGVTWFARQEAGQSDRKQLLGALAIANAGLLLLFAWAIRTTGGRPNQMMSLFALGAVMLLINRLPMLAVRDPRPERVQAGVRVMLLSIIMLDAMLVFIQTENSVPALAIALLLIPATFLGRWIFVT